MCWWDNSSCADCLWVAYGNAKVDECGICWWDWSTCKQPVIVIGCMDQSACNFDANANSDSGCNYISCIGCTNPTACNFDASATVDDRSCLFIDQCWICGGDNTSCKTKEFQWCTDDTACNYNPKATVDNSTCDYLSCIPEPEEEEVAVFEIVIPVKEIKEEVIIAEPEIRMIPQVIETVEEPQIEIVEEKKTPVSIVKIKKPIEIAVPQGKKPEYKGDLWLNSLKHLFECQNAWDDLEDCLANVPESDCPIWDGEIYTEEEAVNHKQTGTNPFCVWLENQFNTDYPQAKESLYINLEHDPQKLEEVINFLGQFITIKDFSQSLYPYSTLTRIDIEPGEMSIASLQWALHYISEISEPDLTAPVPLFTRRWKQDQELVFETSSTSVDWVTFKTSSRSAIFNDPLEISQDYLDNIEFTKAEQLCPSDSSKNPIRIAVIDSAFDTSHEDLQENIVFKKDVSHGDQDTSPPSTEKDWGHGTFSAGIIWAWTNNQRGIASVSKNIAELYLYKASKDTWAPTDISHGLEALVEAAKQKPDIINISWWTFSHGNDIPQLKKIIQDITDQWTIIVASAGNYNSSDPFYPAAYDEVIGVAAVDENNTKASFSNYGDWVDIAAPGTNIMTTTLGNEYWLIHGTSEAAPIVTASIAYILSKWGDINDILSTSLPNTDSRIGRGTLNLANACKNLRIEHAAPQERPPVQMPSSIDSKITKISNHFQLPESRHERFKQIILKQKNPELLIESIMIRFEIQSVDEIEKVKNTFDRHHLIELILAVLLSFFLFMLAIESIFTVLENN